MGWNLNFLFVLDGDQQGKSEKLRYQREFGMRPGEIMTYSAALPSLTVIEDLLDAKATEVVRTVLGLSGSPTKGQICRFFQERLASDTITDLSPTFRSSVNVLLAALQARLEGHGSCNIL